MVVWKIIFNLKNGKFTDVVRDVLWKRQVEPGDVSFAVVGRFTFLFSFLLFRGL